MSESARAPVYLRAVATTLAALAFAGPAFGAVIYEQTITPTFVATQSTNGNENCVASEGCLGKTIGEAGGFAFVIDDIDNGMADGLLPNVLVFNFTLSAAEQAGIRAQAGTGMLIVTAARDIGRRAAEAGGHEEATEWLDARFNDVMVGVGNELFRNVLSTCPFAHSERTADLSCGPNFNSDVKSTAAVGISQALFQAAADFSDIEAELDPTNSVARLKIASVTLRYESIPEPEVWTLMVGALLALAALRMRAAARRRSGKAGCS